jgi:hypothetical protein
MPTESGNQMPIDDQRQAVFVFIKLSDGEMGDESDDTAIYALEDRLNAVIEEHGVGELDGDEWGNGNCQLFMYGDDADKIFDVITPLLLSNEAPSVSYAIKRYGPPGAPERMVHLRANARPG